jgi:hypothetical protein
MTGVLLAVIAVDLHAAFAAPGADRLASFRFQVLLVGGWLRG